VGAGGSYHLLDHLKDVSAAVHVLEAEGTQIELLVGHSMGGNVSLMLAGALPSLVRRMILVDALGPPAEAPDEQPDRLGRVLEARQRVRPFGSFASLEDAMARLRALNPGLSAEGARRMAAPVLVPDEEVEGKLRFPFDARLKGPTPVRHPEEMWHALCARITAPVHVLRAADGYVPEGEPATMRVAAMGDGRMTTVEGVPHHMHVERPEAIADAVREMLAVPAGRATGDQT
jgi:pimeloyl-ACP methyl ester carboxylesterase